MDEERRRVQEEAQQLRAKLQNLGQEKVLAQQAEERIKDAYAKLLADQESSALVMEVQTYLTFVACV